MKNDSGVRDQPRVGGQRRAQTLLFGSSVCVPNFLFLGPDQGGITCGAIDEPRKSSKAIDERVIINFRDKNVVIARFRDKNVYR